MQVLPALGLFLLDCRDRANCMDGLIEAMVGSRNRLIRAFAGDGPEGGDGGRQGLLRNVLDAVTAT